jgi:hypothetical protein
LRDTVLVALNSSDQSPVFRVGLSPRESPELATPQMMKFYVKGGAIEGGKKGFIVPAANQAPYPLTLTAGMFTAALGELGIAVAHRVPSPPATNPGDHTGLSGALDTLDRLLADDIANAAALMEGQTRDDPQRRFGEAPAAVAVDFRNVASGGGQAALDFLHNRQAASYMPDAEPPPGADAPIPLAQEKIRR